jgi:hypothetical protein
MTDAPRPFSLGEGRYCSTVPVFHHSLSGIAVVVKNPFVGFTPAIIWSVHRRFFDPDQTG